MSLRFWQVKLPTMYMPNIHTYSERVPMLEGKARELPGAEEYKEAQRTAQVKRGSDMGWMCVSERLNQYLQRPFPAYAVCLGGRKHLGPPQTKLGLGSFSVGRCDGSLINQLLDMMRWQSHACRQDYYNIAVLHAQKCSARLWQSDTGNLTIRTTSTHCKRATLF